LSDDVNIHDGLIVTVSFTKQQLHKLQVTVEAGPIETCVGVSVRNRRSHQPKYNEDLHQRKEVTGHLLKVGGVDVGSVVEQEASSRQVGLLAGQDERRLSVVGPGVDVSVTQRGLLRQR
jgi:hypothetical protein